MKSLMLTIWPFLFPHIPDWNLGLSYSHGSLSWLGKSLLGNRQGPPAQKGTDKLNNQSMEKRYDNMCTLCGESVFLLHLILYCLTIKFDPLIFWTFGYYPSFWFISASREWCSNSLHWWGYWYLLSVVQSSGLTCPTDSTTQGTCLHHTTISGFHLVLPIPW